MKDNQSTEEGHEVHHVALAEEVSFFNKTCIIQVLEAVPENAKVVIDCSESKSLAYNVIEFIRDY